MLRFDLLKPNQLNPIEWRKLQALQREGLSHQLDRTQEEIDNLISWDDPERFYESHIDPNSEVGERFNSGQSFSNTWLAIASEDNDFVGFAYAANNVSGNKAERFLKRLGTPHNYFWLREFVTRPDLQRQGIAKHLGYMLLTRSNPWQPASTHIWPDEIPFLPDTVRKLSFKPTETELMLPLCGPAHRSVRQVPMYARRTMNVMKQLTK